MDLGNLKYWEEEELAKDSSTSVDVLRGLAKGGNVIVRNHVAENPSAPVDALRELAKDGNYEVRYYVTDNPKVSSKILVMLFEYEKSLRQPDFRVIRALYTHTNLPAFVKRVIETLFGDIL